MALLLRCRVVLLLRPRVTPRPPALGAASRRCLSDWRAGAPALFGKHKLQPRTGRRLSSAAPPPVPPRPYGGRGGARRPRAAPAAAVPAPSVEAEKKAWIAAQQAKRASAGTAAGRDSSGGGDSTADAGNALVVGAAPKPIKAVAFQLGFPSACTCRNPTQLVSTDADCERLLCCSRSAQGVPLLGEDARVRPAAVISPRSLMQSNIWSSFGHHLVIIHLRCRALASVQASTGDIADDFSSLMGNQSIGTEEHDLFSARPVFVPFYSFALADGTTRHVYGGATFDAVSLQVSLFDDLEQAVRDGAIGVAFTPADLEGMRAVDGAEELAHVDEWSLGVVSFQWNES